MNTIEVTSHPEAASQNPSIGIYETAASSISTASCLRARFGISVDVLVHIERVTKLVRYKFGINLRS